MSASTPMNVERSGTVVRDIDGKSWPYGTRRVALLGAGYIADWHAQALKTVAGVELVAVCDPFLNRAEALAQKFGVANVYASLQQMLAAEKLDAVHVLTPPDRHYEPSRTLLEAGVSVFLEKPMCDRADHCDALVRIAAERGLNLGVGHNFLFAPPYEQLRRDVKSGVLGLIDDVVITWHRPLPAATFGPFDAWMLRDPRNMLLEVGPHCIATVLDLVGQPEQLEVRATNPLELPTGVPFYRRWQISGLKGQTAVEVRMSFAPAFSEYTIHVRGSLAAATVDLERHTYTLDEHRPSDPDFETHAIVTSRAKALKKQARATLATYLKSKLKIGQRGNPYGASIARAMDAFYAQQRDPRVEGSFCAQVIRVCEQLGEQVELPATPVRQHQTPKIAAPSILVAAPRILVLGGSGFIGKELLRQLVAQNLPTRVLVRSAAGIPLPLREAETLECVVGNIASKADLLRAMEGVETIFHLARANVKTWEDYQQLEIEATRRVAQCALESGVKRLIYTGTIDSYYCGAGADVITEQTPLDAKIERRNLYARAKAASEEILLRMHREQALPLVIVRPGVVIGHGGSPFHWGVGMWWNDAVCQTWGNGENKLALVLVQDVAAGLITAMNTPGIEGRSFNLVGPPLLTAQDYLNALDASGGIKVQRHATPIARFYLQDMMKWAVKVAVRHPERRLPSYRDWESRTGRAIFDCTAARTTLGWKPVEDREELIRLGIEEPFKEFSL
jgi:predicted dehydrogenase/nucleoside-diphosphate-sugar epimerase